VVTAVGGAPAAAADGGPDNQEAIEESRPVVGRLTITGNEVLSKKVITAVLRLRPAGFFSRPPAFDPALLEEDLARIQELYRRHGYYDVAIATTVEEHDGRVDITLTISEGEPVRVASLQIRCHQDCPDWLMPAGAGQPAVVELDHLLPEPPLAEGDIFAIGAYEEIKRALVRYLADHGHARATIEGEVRVFRREHQADIDFEIVAGQRYRLGTVSVTGNDRVPTSIILRELSVRPGMVFSFSRLVADEARLRRLDLFRRVTVRPDWSHVEATTVPLVVTVEEKPPRGLKLGVGYGTEEDVRGVAEIRWRNFLRRGYTATMEARLSALGHRLRLLFENPWFLGREDLRFSCEIGSRLQNYESFRNQQYYSRAMLARNWAERWTLHVAQNLETNETTDVAPETIAAAVQRFGRVEEQNFFISSLEGGVRFRRLNDPLDPTRGILASYLAEGAVDALGSEFEFLRQQAELRLFQPLPARFGGVLRMKVGSVDPFRSDDYVPISKRFFAGGATSLRGYAFHDVGDKDAHGKPLGGFSLLEISAELRIPLTERLRGVLFLDAGNVFAEPYRLDGGNLLYGAGVGVRYRTPIGPVSVDLGYKLNPESAGESRLRLHVNLGRTF